MIKKTNKEKVELEVAKLNYKKLRNNPKQYNKTMDELLNKLKDSKPPKWGSFKFIFGEKKNKKIINIEPKELL